jgi:hypothetical protein
MRPSGWTRSYWHALDNLYWSPQHLGLKSVPRRLWQRIGDRISIPAELTSDNGPLYYRQRKVADFWPYVQSREETFNHLIDLVMAVLDPRDVAEVFRPLCDLPEGLSFEDPGRDLNRFLSWGEHQSISQPDLFLAGDDALLMVELKFNAKTSLDQLGKYLVLALRYQAVHGSRNNLGLTYVMSASNPRAAVEKQLGTAIESIPSLDVAEVAEQMKNDAARDQLLRDPRAAKELLKAIRVNAIHWGELYSRLNDLADSVGDDPGGRTYTRLLRGLAEAITLHPLSNLPSEV